MDSISINGQDCPVLKFEDGLPVVTYKGHHGVVAQSDDDLDKLMFDGIAFWCPVGSLRISVGNENVRKTPLTQEEVERYVSMVQELGDIGMLVVTEDSTSKLRILDGNNRFPIFVRECDPTHVFVKYTEVSSKLEEMRVQSIANTHTATTHESEAFKALEAKTLTDSLPKGDRDTELSFFYAEIAKGNRGKTEFTKRWKRAKYAIPMSWSALSEGKITVEVIDHLATLINPDTEAVLADLQHDVLKSAIANNLKASQVQAKCAAMFANWEAEQQAVKEDSESFEFSCQPKHGGTFTSTIFQEGSAWKTSKFFDDENEDDPAGVPRLMDKDGGWYRKDEIEHRQSDFSFISAEAIIATIKDVYQVEDDEPEDENNIDLGSVSKVARPKSVTAKVPSTPKSSVTPPSKATAATMVQKKQEVKASKGQGGKKPHAAKTATATKVTTNAPANLPNLPDSLAAAIAANPNVTVAIIGRDPEPPKLVNVDVYQELLDVEDALVKQRIVLSNGSGITKDAWAKMESMSLKDVDDVLSQVQILKTFLTKIEEAASAVQIDLKDQ